MPKRILLKSLFLVSTMTTLSRVLGFIRDTVLAQIFGAGLDVYSEEPPKNIDNFQDINLITTPHIGASTNEAQLKAGLDTVENIQKILTGDDSVAL